jgi:hypothetical protein
MDPILLAHLENILTVNFEEDHLVFSVQGCHFIDDAIPVLLELIAPVATLHEEIDEDMFVLERRIIIGYHCFILLVRLNSDAEGVFPPVWRQCRN